MSQLLYWVFAFCLCIVGSQTEDLSVRNLSKLVGQQPLLFGRRGVNPNMNSLFFGKRTPADPLQPSTDDLRVACAVLISTYERVLASDNDRR